MPGYEDAHRELEDWRRRRRAGVRRFLLNAADDLLGAATVGDDEGHEGAPVRTGHLRGSGVGPDPETGEHWLERDDYMEATVSINTPYAARQHEELDWEHPIGGQAKYLEAPFHARRARYDRALAAELERAVRG